MKRIFFQNRKYVFLLTFLLLGNFFVSENVLALGGGGGEPPAGNANVDGETWIPNGPVESVALDDDYVYLGGAFSYVGPQNGSGAILNPTSGELADSFPNIVGEVYVSVSDGSGGWYLGGNFNTVGGIERNNVAHILSDRSLDTTWNPDALDAVRTIAVSGSDIYVGGDFTFIGGQSRNFIAKLNNTNGNADETWNANANGYVYALAISGSNIYAGGSFVGIGDDSINFVAKLNDTTGTADLTWQPNVLDGAVRSIAISGSDVYLGGDFQYINDWVNYRPYLTKVNNIDGTFDPSWRSWADSSVYAITISGSDIYVGGYFSSIGHEGLTRKGVAKLNNVDGDIFSDFNANVDGIGIYSIAVSEGSVYVAGDFHSIGVEERLHLAKLDSTTGETDPSFVANSNDVADAVAFSGSNLYVGGWFYSIGGETRNNIARINRVSGELDSIWNPNANETIYSIAISNSDIYAGGDFTSIGGESRNFIAKLNNSNGDADPSWDPDSENGINVIAVDGSDIYVGGVFTAIGGESRNYVAKLNNSNGDADESWNPNPDDAVYTMAITGSAVYAGGYFYNIGGQSRNFIAKLNNTNGNADETWNANANGYVYALAISGSDVYVGGDFYSIGGMEREYIAKLNTTNGNADATWSPSTSDYVDTIAISDDIVYVGGGFHSVNEESFRHIAKLDNVTGEPDATWNPNADDYVNSIAVSESDIYVGGNFTSIGENDLARYFAHFTLEEESISSEKAIIDFTISNQVGETVIDEDAKTIIINMPFGTDIAALIPTITTTGESISPPSGTSQDFSEPVVYTVTAEDASTQEYTVTITVATEEGDGEESEEETGGEDYIESSNGNKGEAIFNLIVSSGEKQSEKIDGENGIPLQKIVIEASQKIEGEFNIDQKKEAPDSFEIPNSYKDVCSVYTTLKIDSDFNNKKVEEATLQFRILLDWIEKNKTETIRIFQINSGMAEELDSEKVKATSKNLIVSANSGKLSGYWVVLTCQAENRTENLATLTYPVTENPSSETQAKEEVSEDLQKQNTQPEENQKDKEPKKAEVSKKKLFAIKEVVLGKEGKAASIATVGALLPLVPIATGAGSLVNLTTLFGQNFANLFGFLGYRRNKKRDWGMVYDVKNGEPIPLARISIINKETGKVSEVKMTDKYGSYFFLVSPGKYILSVEKAGYESQSLEQLKEASTFYENNYGGNTLEFGEAGKVSYDLGMKKEQDKISFMESFFDRNIVRFLLSLVFWSGFLINLAVIYYSPQVINFAILALYIYMTLLRSFTAKGSKWGLIINSNDITQPFSNILLQEKSSGNLIARTIADERGRYFLVANAGEYLLSANSVGEISAKGTKEINLSERDSIKEIIELENQ